MNRRVGATALFLVTVGCACNGSSGSGDIESTTRATSPPATSTTGAQPPCDLDRPAELVDCVLIRPSRLGPEWNDLANFEAIGQPDVVGVEEVAMCGSTISLTPQEKRSIRLANLDPAVMMQPGALSELLDSTALQNSTTISASVSYYSDAADATRALQDVRALAESCGGQWTDANDIAHEITVSSQDSTAIEVSVIANPMATLLAQDSEQQLCEDPIVANAIDLVIGSTEQTAITPDQLRDFICSGTMGDLLNILLPFGEISLEVRVSAIDQVLVSTVAATSPAASDSEIVDRIHSDMVTRSGG